jgi:hypothetical protein
LRFSKNAVIASLASGDESRSAKILPSSAICSTTAFAWRPFISALVARTEPGGSAASASAASRAASSSSSSGTISETIPAASAFSAVNGWPSSSSDAARW